jgi:hypothetical protein
MTFVEETLGESVVRCTSGAISILIGTAVSVFLLLKGEITMGSLLTYTSDNTVHVGELQNIDSNLHKIFYEFNSKDFFVDN